MPEKNTIICKIASPIKVMEKFYKRKTSLLKTIHGGVATPFFQVPSHHPHKVMNLLPSRKHTKRQYSIPIYMQAFSPLLIVEPLCNFHFLLTRGKQPQHKLFACSALVKDSTAGAFDWITSFIQCSFIDESIYTFGKT